MSTDISSELLTTIEPILPFILTENDDNTIYIYNEKVHDFITKLKYSQFETILCSLTNQMPISKIKNLEYTIYKQNFMTSKFEHYLDIKHDSSIVSYPNEVQISDQTMVLNMMSIRSMVDYINKHKSNRRYIYFPFTYSSETKTCSHQAMLVLDTMENNVYLMDPNGSTSYFNDILYESLMKNGFVDENKARQMNNMYGINYNSVVEDMIQKYFEQFQIFNMKYTYIRTKKWNPYRKSLNSSKYEDTYIGTGHCVILTLLLCHFSSVTGYDLEEIWKVFGKLSKDDMVVLINNYTCNIYNLYK